MILLFVAGLMVFNFAISVWNAVVVGKTWEESKHAGGWPRFMVWMTAVMSSLGFTWCYLIIAAIILTSTGHLTSAEVSVLLNLGYIVIVPGVIFAGLMIMIDSWGRAYRERTVDSYGLAGYNTFANVYNIYQASSGLPSALKEVGSYFGKAKSADERKAAAIILIVIVCVGLGVLTTWGIARKAAASRPSLQPPPMSSQFVTQRSWR